MLFPDLQAKKFGYLNLNVVAERWSQRNKIGFADPNPLLDPEVCDEMVQEAHDELGLDFSYGGWLENRTSLWRGSYLDEKGAYLHLGVDFSVPVGTRVAAEVPGRVVQIDNDVPTEGGWGTRVIVEPEGGSDYLIYAHLDPQVSIQIGDRLKRGDVFAKVGASPVNGGWFSHLHVQCVEKVFFEDALLRDLEEIDGYGREADRAQLSRIFQDPLQFVFVGSKG